MVVIGNGSFSPQRRRENQVVSDLADQGLLLNGNVTIETIIAFSLTRNLSPKVLLLMYKQAGLIDEDVSIDEGDHFADIYRSRS